MKSDDGPQYAWIQAILYGLHLLAGLTTDDWDLKTGSATSLSDWITPIPASHNSLLVSRSREFGSLSFVFFFTPKRDHERLRMADSVIKQSHYKYTRAGVGYCDDNID